MKINKKTILKIIKYLLFLTALILIYLVSPKIANYIQYVADCICKIDTTYITRAIELILTSSFLLAIKETKLEVKNDRYIKKR